MDLKQYRILGAFLCAIGACCLFSTAAYSWTCEELSRRNPQSPIQCGGQTWAGGRVVSASQQGTDPQTHSSYSIDDTLKILFGAVGLMGAGMGVWFLVSWRKASRAADSVNRRISEKVYCKICHGLHPRGDVFCPQRGQKASSGAASSLARRPERYEFKYKWRIEDQEFAGELECENEESLRSHLKANGGELVEVLEKTKVVVRPLGQSPVEPALPKNSGARTGGAPQHVYYLRESSYRSFAWIKTSSEEEARRYAQETMRIKNPEFVDLQQMIIGMGNAGWSIVHRDSETITFKKQIKRFSCLVCVILLCFFVLPALIYAIVTSTPKEVHCVFPIER